MVIRARLLEEGDEVFANDFLAQRTPWTIQMRSKLKKSGLLLEGKPTQAEFFCAFINTKPVGILAHGGGNDLQVFATDLSAIPSLAQAWRQQRACEPRNVERVRGPAEQVNKLLSALGVEADMLRHEGGLENIYTLAAKEMTRPKLLDAPGIVVRSANMDDKEALALRLQIYEFEATHAPMNAASLNAAEQKATQKIEAGDMYVLETEGDIVSLCCVDCSVPRWGFVGPVYTTKDERNKGYARAVVAGALEICRTEKRLSNAVLFTEFPEMDRSCTSIGFRPVNPEKTGDWSLAIFKKPMSSAQFRPA